MRGAPRGGGGGITGGAEKDSGGPQGEPSCREKGEKGGRKRGGGGRGGRSGELVARVRTSGGACSHGEKGSRKDCFGREERVRGGGERGEGRGGGRGKKGEEGEGGRGEGGEGEGKRYSCTALGEGVDDERAKLEWRGWKCLRNFVRMLRAQGCIKGGLLERSKPGDQKKRRTGEQ